MPWRKVVMKFVSYPFAPFAVRWIPDVKREGKIRGRKEQKKRIEIDSDQILSQVISFCGGHKRIFPSFLRSFLGAIDSGFLFFFVFSWESPSLFFAQRPHILLVLVDELCKSTVYFFYVSWFWSVHLTIVWVCMYLEWCYLPLFGMVWIEKYDLSGFEGYGFVEYLCSFLNYNVDGWKWMIFRVLRKWLCCISVCTFLNYNVKSWGKNFIWVCCICLHVLLITVWSVVY